jgi:SAM-dependent methyltransferase
MRRQSIRRRAIVTGVAGRLFLTSATILFVELLLIRWVPANVVYVGFFNNLVLMASFLGIGLGIVLGRRWSDWSLPLFGPLLLGLAIVVYAARVDLTTGPALFLGSSERPQLRIDVAVVGAIGVFVMATMAALSMPLAGLLRSMPPLRAYAIDIAGSMTGIAAFAALAVLGGGPSVWLTVLLGLVIVLGMSSARRRATYGGIAAVAAALGITIALGRGDVWSPYYRIDLYGDADGLTSLAVNGVPYQKMWPAGSPKEPFYEQVYEWLPGRRSERVLIIGAGTGTDVAVALAHGAGRVEAVEIDPFIEELGRKLHPSRPYQDERVHVTIADGRAFLRSTDARYDLVVFGSTDSLTLVTSTANLRLESFLFTEEAFASVRDHLTPSGVFVMYNWYREPWLVARYAGMLERTFGSRPAVRVYGGGYTEVQAAILGAGPGLDGAGIPEAGLSVDTAGPVRDDAPFPYLRSRAIPASGIAGLATMLVVAVGATLLSARLSSVALRQGSVHFFLLGAAFLLLETKSLVTFSLLFGTTWLVNALVFFAILASVLAAIAVTANVRTRDPRWYYAGLFGSLALAYVVPPSDLLFEPAVLRYAIASVMTFAPIFFANLVFARSFRDSQAADLAFASNLLGAMVGGAIEWSAIAIGYRGLALVVAVLYLGAYLTAARFRVLGDRSLVSAEPALE